MGCAGSLPYFFMQTFVDSVHLPPAFSQAGLVVCWDSEPPPLGGLAAGSLGEPPPGCPG